MEIYIMCWLNHKDYETRNIPVGFAQCLSPVTLPI